MVLPDPELSFRFTDLLIDSAQLRKILLATLYYLEVEADRQILYKIGVTTRSISKRLEEIQRELRSHFQTVAIKVFGTWVHRGNIEKYLGTSDSQFKMPRLLKTPSR